MSNYKHIPVETAVQIARHFEKAAVLIVALDRVHSKTDVTTYGVEPADKEIIAEIGDRVGVLVSGSTDRSSFEDFRFVDQAKRAKEIRELRDFAREFIALWDELWVEPDEVSHEWSGLYQRAKELVDALEV